VATIFISTSLIGIWMENKATMGIRAGTAMWMPPAKLYDTTPSAELLASRAKGILVFPNVVKAGFIGGAQYGKGALRKQGRTAGYYNLVAGSFGFQAGEQSFDYALFFMNGEALSYLDRSGGFEIGLGPHVVVLDAGAAGVTLEGSKITRINP
jgi:lipid-binding SYLF domain-containing protein